MRACRKSCILSINSANPTQIAKSGSNSAVFQIRKKKEELLYINAQWAIFFPFFSQISILLSHFHIMAPSPYTSTKHSAETVSSKHISGYDNEGKVAA